MPGTPDRVRETLRAQALDVVAEITAYRGDAVMLHPRKLERWHTSLLELPDAMFMQLNCLQILEHCRKGAEAVNTVLDVMGELTPEPQEIARRKAGPFRWYLPGPTPGVMLFETVWNKNQWALSTPGVDTVKFVPDLNVALEKAREWVSEAGAEPDEDASDL